MTHLSLRSMARTLSLFIGVFTATFLYATPSFGRDLQGRVGLGMNGNFPNQRGNSIDGKGIALKYGFTKDLAVEPVIAFSTGTSAQSTFGLKFFKNIFYETNLNFYFFGAGALMKNSGDSSYALQSGFGAEFFIPGIESLGFSFELGAELSDTYGNSTSLRTLGMTFVDAGMRFYF